MNAKTTKELRRIMSSIPKELQDNITTKTLANPTLNELYQRALKDKEADPEAVRKLELLKKAGYMDETTEIVNEDVVKKIDVWLEEQIKRSIKLGRLPDPKTDKDYKKLISKSKKYVQTNSAN